MLSMNDDFYIYRENNNVIHQGNIEERKIQRDTPAECLLSFELDTSQTGSIFVIDNLGNSETIAFTSSGFARSVSEYSQIEGMSPSGLTGDVKITAINYQNEKICYTDQPKVFRGSLQSKTKKQWFSDLGLEINEYEVVLAPYDLDVLAGDLIKINDPNSDDYYEVYKIFEPKVMGRVQRKEMILVNHNK